MDTVNGEPVALYVRNPEKGMDVKNATVGKELDISGAHMNLDNVTQRPGDDEFLTIKPNGASDDQPIEQLDINNLRTNTGAHVTHLWLRDGSIKATKGKLYLDKVYILDKA